MVADSLNKLDLKVKNVLWKEMDKIEKVGDIFLLKKQKLH